MKDYQMSEIQNLISMHNDNSIRRLGKVFKSDDDYYFYDTGTGKVIEFDINIYKVINTLFEEKRNITDIIALVNYAKLILKC